MRKITDLHGNTYKLGDYTLEYNFPKFKDYISFVFTKDILSGKSINIVTCKAGIYGIKYSLAYKLYVVFKLKLVSHDDRLDIRKAYLHGNKHHS